MEDRGRKGSDTSPPGVPGREPITGARALGPSKEHEVRQPKQACNKDWMEAARLSSPGHTAEILTVDIE